MKFKKKKIWEQFKCRKRHLIVLQRFLLLISSFCFKSIFYLPFLKSEELWILPLFVLQDLTELSEIFPRARRCLTSRLLPLCYILITKLWNSTTSCFRFSCLSRQMFLITAKPGFVATVQRLPYQSFYYQSLYLIS